MLMLQMMKSQEHLWPASSARARARARTLLPSSLQVMLRHLQVQMDLQVQLECLITWPSCRRRWMRWRRNHWGRPRRLPKQSSLPWTCLMGRPSRLSRQGSRHCLHQWLRQSVQRQSLPLHHHQSVQRPCPDPHPRKLSPKRHGSHRTRTSRGKDGGMHPTRRQHGAKGHRGMHRRAGRRHQLKMPSLTCVLTAICDVFLHICATQCMLEVHDR